MGCLIRKLQNYSVIFLGPKSVIETVIGGCCFTIKKSQLHVITWSNYVITLHTPPFRGVL